MCIRDSRGAAPSGIIINPLPPAGSQEYDASGQGYFWTFVRDYAQLIQDSEAQLDFQEESFSLTSNSYIHLTSRATDSDGNITSVRFYLNDKLLGEAKKMHESPHYVLPVDLSTFGEQPTYRIDSMIRDDSGNINIPNNPLTLNVLPASSARPEISIVVPDPGATSIPKYAMGSPIGLGVDILPREGTVESVSMYANGRFIGFAEIQDDFEFGRKRYALRWTAENPGRYHLTASVRDNLGTVVFTDKGIDVDVVNSTGSLPPGVNMIFPMPGAVGGPMALTSTSTIRLEANASDPDGNLLGVEFFANGRKMSCSRLTFSSVNSLSIDDILSVTDAFGSSTEIEFFEFPITDYFDDVIVQFLYSRILEREPSPAEIIYWTGYDAGVEEFVKELLKFPELSGKDRISLPIQADQASSLSKDLILAAIKASGLQVQIEDSGDMEVMIDAGGVSEAFESSNPDAISVESISLLERSPSQTPGKFPFGINWSPGQPGYYTVHAEALDNSGNRVMSEPVSVTATTGTTAPVVELLSPGKNLLVGQVIDLFAISENTGDRVIKEVMFFANGRLLGVDSSRGYGVKCFLI